MGDVTTIGQASVRWLPVVGWEDRYDVSDHGQVRSRIPGRPMRVLRGGFAGSQHYAAVALARSGRATTRVVHQLVLESFDGPRPAGSVARHLNGDKNDNRVSNLAWGTQSENMQDTLQHGTHARGSATSCKRGHPLSGANLYLTPGGARRCIACVNGRKRGEDMTLTAENWRQPEMRTRAAVRSSYHASPSDDWRVFPRLIGEAGCWRWTGALTHGYGIFGIKPKTFYVHRWMYERLVNDIPTGLFLDHLCRRRECCNPEHLDPVTTSVNMLRAFEERS